MVVWKHCSVFHAHVLTQGAWKTLAQLKDPELRKLATSLPATVMHSHADRTICKYMCAFKHWKVWTELHLEVTVYSVSDVHLILHLQHLGETTQSRAAVEEAVNAIG